MEEFETAILKSTIPLPSLIFVGDHKAHKIKDIAKYPFCSLEL